MFVGFFLALSHTKGPFANKTGEAKRVVYSQLIAALEQVRDFLFGGQTSFGR